VVSGFLFNRRGSCVELAFAIFCQESGGAVS